MGCGRVVKDSLQVNLDEEDVNYKWLRQGRLESNGVILDDKEVKEDE